MIYRVPNISANLDLTENLKNIDKTVDNLNKRRDKGLDSELENRLKRHLLISQVYNSNAIEGNKLSLRETEIILDGMLINERPLKDEIEAQSLSIANEFLYRLIDGSEQLGKRALLELHQLILKNIPGHNGGEFRKDDVSIKNSDHKPISYLQVENEVDELFKWVNRNMHKYNPVVMSSILHHWLVWIHPFSDGNGRVTRLFTNFFLLQKGYPEVIVKLGDRDKYYNALIDADNGDVTGLVELFSDKLRQTINIYEEFLNEHDRQLTWKRRYKDIAEKDYTDAKETFSYQYEVWKNQINTFKTILEKNIEFISKTLPNYTFSIKDYDILSYNQYVDILEDRKVSNTWYFSLSIKDEKTAKNMGFIFYFERFKPTGKVDLSKPEMKIKPHIKLYVTGRKEQESFWLARSIDLVNIGTHRDQLSFGVHNVKWRPEIKDQNTRASIITIKDNPNKIVRTFIDQILYTYFNIGKRLPSTQYWQNNGRTEKK